MNHDATHCDDYTEACPKSCHIAQLTEELKHIHYALPISWAHYKGTNYCPKWPKEGK